MHPDLLPGGARAPPATAEERARELKAAGKFKSRYAILGFSDLAHLDDGPMWADSYALSDVTPQVEQRITDLVQQAVS